MLGRRVIVGLLLLVNLYLLLGLVWSGQGFFSYLELKNRYQNLRQELETLEQSSRELSADIMRLESDPDYQERMIRERMNYVRENEVLYVFPKDADASGEGDDAKQN